MYLSARKLISFSYEEFYYCYYLGYLLSCSSVLSFWIFPCLDLWPTELFYIFISIFLLFILLSGRFLLLLFFFCFIFFDFSEIFFVLCILLLLFYNVLFLLHGWVYYLIEDINDFFDDFSLFASYLFPVRYFLLGICSDLCLSYVILSSNVWWFLSVFSFLSGALESWLEALYLWMGLIAMICPARQSGHAVVSLELCSKLVWISTVVTSNFLPGMFVLSFQ